MVRKRNFSLSELLVVIAIILVLASLLIVTVGEIYGTARRVACQQRLEQIGYACQLFSVQNKGRELRCLDLLGGGNSLRWYEKLLPYFNVKSTEDAKVHLNCPVVDLVESSAETLGAGRSLDMPILIYRTSHRTEYGSYEGLRDDFRASDDFGGCDLIQFKDAGDAPLWQDNGLNRYCQVWVFSLSEWRDDAFHPNTAGRRDPAPIKEFRENGGGLFMCGDHSGSSANSYGGWNTSLNEIADRCKLGICVRHARSHNENVQSTGHFIGNEITRLPKGTAWGSVGHVSIDDRVNDERTERHQFVSYPIVCTGQQPGGDHCPWPDKILPGVHEQPCGVIGVMDDGLGRVCIGSTFTRWGTSYYNGSTSRHQALWTFAEQTATWLSGGYGRGGDSTYGYNNQIGIGPDDKGLGPTTPNPGRTIRVLDYMFYQADHDGEHGADDDITCIAARHGGRANVLFADGHVEALTPDEIMDESRAHWDVQK